MDGSLGLIEARVKTHLTLVSPQWPRNSGEISDGGCLQRVVLLADARASDACEKHVGGLLDSAVLFVHAARSRVSQNRIAGQPHISVTVGIADLHHDTIIAIIGNAVTLGLLHSHSGSMTSVPKPLSRSNETCGSTTLHITPRV